MENLISLTTSQLSLYYSHALSDAPNLFNITGCGVINGKIDHVKFEKSIHELNSTHPILKGYVHVQDNEPTYRIPEAGRAFFRFIDLAEKPEQHKIEALDEIKENEADYVFDLHQDVLLRHHLIKLSETRYAWVINIHHIISDGWTMSLIYRNVSRLYDSASEEKTSEAHEGITDYLEFEEEYKSSAKYQKDELFWTAILEHQPNKNMYKAFSKSVSSTHAVRKTIRLEPEVSARIYELCETGKHSIKDFFFSLLSVYLSHVFETSQVMIETSVLNRPKKKYKETVGKFVNFIPVSVDLKHVSTFIELMALVKNEHSNAFRHQRFPVHELYSKLNRTKGDMCPVMFNYQSSTFATTFSEFDVDQEWLFCGHDEHVFTVNINDFNESSEISINFDFNLSVFSDSEQALLIERFLMMIHTVSKLPEIELNQITILSDTDRKVITDINKTEDLSLLDKLVVYTEMFNQASFKYPQSVAIKDGFQEVTYSELNRWSSQLARTLKNNDIRLSDRVVVYGENTMESVVSMLALWKIGAVYVPVDRSYPVERVKYIITDSAAKIVLSTDSLENFEFDIETQRIPKLDEHTDILELQCPVSLEDDAYIIYTSGTTGQPKGVLNAHRQISHYCAQFLDYFHLNSKDTVAQQASISFDTSFEEILPTLAVGAKLVMVSHETVQNYSVFSEQLLKDQISVLSTSPAIIRLMNTEQFESDCLRVLISGGDTLFTTDTAFLSSKYNVYNTYGPTETTICATYARVKNDVSLGKPLKNTSVYLLNENLEQQPVGVVGEICIGGVGVTKGYTGKPELTSDVFLKNPFQKSGFFQKLYKTGDLGRLNFDGSLSFCGRKDNQVSISGYRIELQEIEMTINQFPKINEAIVLVHEFGAGNQQLVLFFKGNTAVDHHEIKSFISLYLPFYMVPTVYREIDHFPLDSNGKINRKALQKQCTSIALDGELFTSSSETENALLQIWKEVLGIEEISVGVSFFELGGNSLKVMQVKNRIADGLQTELSFKDLFTYTTLPALAHYIDSGVAKHNSPILPIKVSDYYDLSHAQKQLWLLDQVEATKTIYHIPRAFYLKGSLNADRLKRSMETLLERHESLRTSFIALDGEPKQVIHEMSDLDVPFFFNDWSVTDHSAEDVLRFIENDAIQPFDLETAPLFRFQLIKLGENKHVGVFNTHHIISDGWSIDVLLSELFEVYQTLCEGKEIKKPELSIQYKEFAAWQKEYLSSEAAEEDRNFWKSQFASGVPLLELQTDFPRPEIQTYNGDSYKFILNERLTKAIDRLQKKLNSSDYTQFLSFIGLLLQKYSGQSDLVIGSPIAGRHLSSDLEKQVGFYINTLPIRVSCTSDQVFSKYVLGLQKQVEHTLKHQNYPFDCIVDDLTIVRDRSRFLMFDVGFTWHQEYLPMDLSRYNLELSLIDNGFVSTQTDLWFHGMRKGNRIGNRIEFEIAYNTDLFTELRIQQMSDHFVHLIEDAVAHFDLKIEALEMMDTQEKERILNQAVSKERVSHFADILETIEKQAVETPDAIAVESGSCALSYQELNEKANRMANFLKESYQLSRNEHVAILMKRSEQTIIALLAVLKLRAVFIPIESSYPTDRRQFILDDTQAKLLITESDYLMELAGFAGHVFVMDMELESLDKGSENLCLRPEKLDNAYIIYTSGSTGNPKGVLVGRDSLVNLCEWYIESHQITSETNALFMIPFGFDASIKNIFCPIMVGGKITVAPEGHYDANLLLEIIFTRKVTLINCVPSAFKPVLYLAKEDHYKKLCSLKRLAFGGEALDLNSFKDWLNLSTCTITNIYGPTECTDISIAYEITSDDIRLSKTIPIGQGIINSKIYIVNENTQLVPQGFIGEIAIGGVGVAKGYLNQPELTNEHFILNPFSETVENVYKTGDLARLNRDGQIEFLGRKDFQVKIRGNRIEVAEIENALLHYPTVKEQIVLAKEYNGDKTLVAYLVLEDALNQTELRRFLTSRLPAYMVPSYFVTLPQMPLNSNGKIDRKVLPDPDWSSLETMAEYVAPQSELEVVIIKLWQEVLSVDRVGMLDNYFELGGDSIKAVRLISQIIKQYKIDLDVGELYTDPTVVGLCELLRQKGVIDQGEQTENSETIQDDINSLKNEFGSDLDFLNELDELSQLFDSTSQTNKIKG